MTDATKTIQLRRYEIVEGELDAFIAWFGSTLVPARDAEGFAIEFAYADREVNEFVWATSAPGDAAAFAAAEEAYMASETRAKAFAGQPQRVAVYHVRLIEPIV
ncbi:hypothetical protein HQQ80_12615 [Microbacteriaceae bacterium VKM Ac-2855]|nr:hypothetical protein [Microbacteriaceae bacterium VKM Ac-2855]